ncbi:hypothetical protein RQP54_03820 [Curvibacter sp. APW13]|nr:hypothetical protein [Curvibacter sp. APW13]MDT8989981.1 hypothetical protein [Curvibacter sp. APW13]
MSAKILAATVLVLLVATVCTLAYAMGDALRWAAQASRYNKSS